MESLSKSLNAIYESQSRSRTFFARFDSLLLPKEKASQ
jgi:hypothetical protein